MLFPDNEISHVVELSAGIWNATRAHLETRLRPLGMTWPQFGALLALSDHDGATQRELGELLECDRTTMSVICDSLEKHGWAERHADERDRRVKRIRMTQGGREAIAEAQPMIWEAYDTVAAVLTPEEIAVVVPKLERVYASIRTLSGSGCLDSGTGA